VTRVYRTQPSPQTRRRPPRASWWRRLVAQWRGVPGRLDARRAWLELPDEVRVALRRVKARERLLQLGDHDLVVQATARVVAAWEHEKAMDEYHSSGGAETGGMPPLPPPDRAPPMGNPLWRELLVMRRAVMWSAWWTDEALKALQDGRVAYALLQVVRHR